MATKIVMDTIGVFLTAPGATVVSANAGMFPGDSNQLRNFDQPYLLPSMHLAVAAGVAQVSAGSMPDPTYGIRSPRAVGASFENSSLQMVPITKKDTLNFSLSGSAGAGKIETFVQPIIYEDANGTQSGSYIDAATLDIRKTGSVFTAYATFTAGTAGGYSGATLISAMTQAIRSNVNLALLGITTSIAQAAITVKGAGTGNFRVAVPGVTGLNHITSRYFPRLSARTGKATIPVINSLDFSNTTVEVVNNDSAASPIVYLFFAELKY